MSRLNSEQLERYLKEYGWVFKRIDDRKWRTGFQGDERFYPMSIQLNDTCVSFEVSPLVDLTLDMTRWPELAKELLEINSRMQLVKAAVGENGELILSCQALAQDFSYETCSRLLGVIGYYADELASEIFYKMELQAPSNVPTLLS